MAGAAEDDEYGVVEVVTGVVDKGAVDEDDVASDRIANCGV